MNLNDTRACLDRHGLHLSRDRGQNFLVDDEQARRLASLAGVRSGDRIVEVGTGLGTLSCALAERVAPDGRLLSVELDAGLVRVLREEGLLPGGVELLHADALGLDLRELLSGLPGEGDRRLVANLPYSAATPLLRRLLDVRDLLADWSVMVQRELADRLCGEVGTRDYGSLAVLHRLCVDVTRTTDLSPRCFFPVPKVHSSFLRVTPRTDCLVVASELEGVERVVRGAFAQRRKTLVNSLLGAGALPDLDRERIEAALEALGIDPRTRAERLDPEALLALARSLDSGGR